jgi:tetratricopeptide (TPR) repeat protein
MQFRPRRADLALRCVHGYQRSKQMHHHSQDRSARITGLHRRLIAMIVVLPLMTGVFAAAHPALAAAPASSEQPRDTDLRNRQYQHAEALYLSGHLKEAAKAFEELSRAYPNDARIRLKYGNTLTKQGSYDSAAAAFESAAALDPTQGNASLNLALVRLAQAQAALDLALARLAENSPEHMQAESLQRQIKILLGAPDSGASPH